VAVQIPAQAIADARAGAGNLWQLVLAIAQPESGWRADAEGDYKLVRGGQIVPSWTPGASPMSFGYTQMYTDGGLGDGYSPAQLKDGPTNFRLAANAIRSTLNGGGSIYDALQPWSTRDAAYALYQRIQAEGIESGGAAVAGPVSLPGDSVNLPVVGNVPTLALVGAAVLLLLAAD
jgi:hypothetical protein